MFNSNNHTTLMIYPRVARFIQMQPFESITLYLFLSLADMIISILHIIIRTFCLVVNNSINLLYRYIVLCIKITVEFKLPDQNKSLPIINKVCR